MKNICGRIVEIFKRSSDPGYFYLFTSIRIPVMILRVLLLEHLISVALFTGEAEDICASFSNMSFFSPEKLLVLEGFLQRRGGGGWLWLTMRTRTLAAEVLGSTPWRELSQSLPLAPPPYSFILIFYVIWKPLNLLSQIITY